jgi:hypothetical protein
LGLDYNSFRASLSSNNNMRVVVDGQNFGWCFYSGHFATGDRRPAKPCHLVSLWRKLKSCTEVIFDMAQMQMQTLYCLEWLQIDSWQLATAEDKQWV